MCRENMVNKDSCDLHQNSETQAHMANAQGYTTKLALNNLLYMLGRNGGFSVLKQKNFVSIYFLLKLICLRNAHYLAVKNFWQAFYILYFHHSSLKLF
jgi:hypothetical protein